MKYVRTPVMYTDTEGRLRVGRTIRSRQKVLSAWEYALIAAAVAVGTIAASHLIIEAILLAMAGGALMELPCTPDQVHDWVSALGAADSVLRDLAAKPEQLVGGEQVPGIFRKLMRQQAEALRSLQSALTAAYNEAK